MHNLSFQEIHKSVQNNLICLIDKYFSNTSMGTALYIMVLTYYKRIRQAEIYKVNVFITQMHYHSKQLPSDLKVKIYHILNFIRNIFSDKEGYMNYKRKDLLWLE